MPQMEPEPQKVWIKIRFGLMLTSNLIRETNLFLVSQNCKDNAGQYKLIREVFSQTLKEVLVLDENSINTTSLNYYLGSQDVKNVVSTTHHSMFMCAQYRSQVKRLYIYLCQLSHEYEPIKEIYKKSTHTLKSQYTQVRTQADLAA